MHVIVRLLATMPDGNDEFLYQLTTLVEYYEN